MCELEYRVLKGIEQNPGKYNCYKMPQLFTDDILPTFIIIAFSITTIKLLTSLMLTTISRCLPNNETRLKGIKKILLLESLLMFISGGLFQDFFSLIKSVVFGIMLPSMNIARNTYLFTNAISYIMAFAAPIVIFVFRTYSNELNDCAVNDLIKYSCILPPVLLGHCWTHECFLPPVDNQQNQQVNINLNQANDQQNQQVNIGLNQVDDQVNNQVSLISFSNINLTESDNQEQNEEQIQNINEQYIHHKFQQRISITEPSPKDHHKFQQRISITEPSPKLHKK